MAAEIEWVILADQAEVTGGRLFLMGGGWDTLSPQSFPAQLAFALAVSVKVDWQEVVDRKRYQLDILHIPEGGPELTLASAQMEPQPSQNARPGEPQRAQFAIRGFLQFQGPGKHEITVRIGRDQTRSVAFYVNPPSAQVAPEPSGKATRSRAKPRKKS